MDKQGGICEDDVQGPEGPRDTKGGSIRGFLALASLPTSGGTLSWLTSRVSIYKRGRVIL